MPSASYTRVIGLVLVWLAGAGTVFGQYQPWAVQWNQHAFNACAGRRYLGVTNLVAGSNVIFSVAANPCDYKINVTPGTMSGVASAKGVTPLVNGSVTITTPLANKTNVIHVTYVTDHLKTAYVMVSDIVDGVSFKIQGSTSGDTNLVCWSVFNP